MVTSWVVPGRTARKALSTPVAAVAACAPDCPVWSPRLRTPMMSTAMIGPMEANPTRPKLSSSALFAPRTAATPTPKAMMKGTVMGPVVAPPASKAMPRYWGAEK